MTHRKIRRQKGSALLAALGLLFMAGMLTGTILMLSKITVADIRPHVELQRSAYRNEGMANRIEWLIAADRTLNPNDTPGTISYDDYDYERFMADGVEHEMSYHGTMMHFTITEAAGGMDLSGNAFRNTIQGMAQVLQLSEEDISDEANTLISRITDYQDTDSDLSDDGMEESDYESANLQPLPRNGAIQFREEYLWIPGFTALFPPDTFTGRMNNIRMIAPPGMDSLAGGSPNFFTATPRIIKIYCNLEDEQVEEVIKTRKEFFKERIPLADIMSEDLLPILQSNLSFQETGNYSVTVRTASGDGVVSRTLYFTFPAFNVTGAQGNQVRHYEWFTP